MIPLLLKLRIKPKDRRGFNIWFPFFLFWLIILPLVILISPLIMLAALLTWKEGTGKKIFYGYKAIFLMIFYMSGLKIDVQTQDSIVFINLI